MTIITPQIHLSDGKVTTTTREIAGYFGKLHKNVLRKLESLECSLSFRELNFEPTFYLMKNPKGSGFIEQKKYKVTKDGFTFLAMGFTGKKAAEFKEKYIAEFNRMESQLQKQQDAFHKFPSLSPFGRLQLKRAASRFIDLFGGVETTKDADTIASYLLNAANDYNHQKAKIRAWELLGLCDRKMMALAGARFNTEILPLDISKPEFDELLKWIRAQPSRMQQPEDLPLPVALS